MKHMLWALVAQAVHAHAHDPGGTGGTRGPRGRTGPRGTRGSWDGGDGGAWALFAVFFLLLPLLLCCAFADTGTWWGTSAPSAPTKATRGTRRRECGPSATRATSAIRATRVTRAIRVTGGAIAGFVVHPDRIEFTDNEGDYNVIRVCNGVVQWWSMQSRFGETVFKQVTTVPIVRFDWDGRLLSSPQVTSVSGAGAPSDPAFMHALGELMASVGGHVVPAAATDPPMAGFVPFEPHKGQLRPGHREFTYLFEEQE